MATLTEGSKNKCAMATLTVGGKEIDVQWHHYL